MTFGEKIFALRKEIDATAKEVAQQVGTSPSTLLRMEKGTVYPKTPEMIEAFAKFYGCTVKELTDDSIDIVLQHDVMPVSDERKADGKSAPAKGKKVVQIASRGRIIDAVPKEYASKAPEIATDAPVEKAPDDTVAPVEPEQTSVDTPFGKRLSILRKDKNLKLDQVADAAGIKTGAYKGMEYRNSRPKDVKVYDRLAEVLGCDVSYLTAGDERFKSETPTMKESKSKAVNESEPVVSSEPVISSEPVKETKATPIELVISSEQPAPAEDKPANTPFGKKLNTLRKENNLTLAQVADKIGVTLSAYKGMEYRNSRPMTMREYRRLAKTLGCEVDYLTEGDLRYDKSADVPKKKVVIIPATKVAEKAVKKQAAPVKENEPAVASEELVKATVEKDPVLAEAETEIEPEIIPTPSDIRKRALIEKVSKDLVFDPDELMKMPMDELDEIDAEDTVADDIGVEDERAEENNGEAALSEVIRLVSRLSVLLSGDEISQKEKDAVMLSLNGAYWGRR